MTVLEVLVAARAKIEREENWTRKMFARNASGESTCPSYDDATSFCALGALMAVAQADVIDRPIRLLERATQVLYDCLSPVSINDGPDGHASVLAIYDEAIRHERATA